MNSEEYFFDNLRQLTDVTKKGKKVREGELFNVLNTVINFIIKLDSHCD